MTDTPIDETPTAEPEPEEEVDDTVPCPACHQATRLSLLAEKYAADVPSKYRPKGIKGG